jgi:pimeloyl-ACP methyl ester carboxylesterase
MKTRLIFASASYTDVTGFVAADNTNKLVVISFRGSVSEDNFIADVNYTRVESDLCPNCLVHRGFWFSWTEARNQTLTALMSIAKAYPSYKVVVTGHSLGAAIATFCAAEVRKLGYEASLVSSFTPS